MAKMKDIRESVNDTLKYLGFLALVVIVICLVLPWPAQAITPPVVTQPKPGVIRFTWTAPATRENGSALSAGEIGGYELYLTNESAVIKIAGTATSYDYTVPVGYTTLSTDTAQLMALDVAGVKSAPSAAVALPVGVTSPKPRIGAPGGFTAARAP